MRDPKNLISRIANTGEIDPEAARWLADSLRGWWIDGSDPSRLPAFLHLACGSRSEIAAGRATDGTIDLPTERALLARSQREGQTIKNEVARGTYAPIDVLADVLANASQSVVDHLNQLPAGINRVCPDLPQAVRDLVMTEVSRARNEMVRETVSLVSDALDSCDTQEEDEAIQIEDFEDGGN